jgi:phosphoribosylanthranilate isomerase
VAAIKICGITRLEDAIFIARCGADALGFIFYPKSPRYITPQQAKKIIDELPVHHQGQDPIAARSPIMSPNPGRITTIGVFVNEDSEIVQEIASFCALDLLQLHGGESAAYCRHFPPERIIKAVALRTADDLRQIRDFPCRAILVDAYAPQRHGGTGRTANWELAAQAKNAAPLILSGGLHAGNIRKALAAVKPDAVDINSGVETSPGVKDHNKIREIIGLIRA